MAAIAMSQSGFMTPAASKAESSAASVFAILDQKSTIDTSDESGMTLEQVKGDIEFQHVTFKYPTRPHVPVFKDLSLTIHAGEVTCKIICFFFFEHKSHHSLITLMDIRQLL